MISTCASNATAMLRYRITPPITFLHYLSSGEFVRQLDPWIAVEKPGSMSKMESV